MGNLCIVCGNETEPINQVICIDCESKEKIKQRQLPGTITTKQVSYIEHLMEGMSTQESSEILWSALPEYDGDLENLSTNEAGIIIKTLKGELS